MTRQIDWLAQEQAIPFMAGARMNAHKGTPVSPASYSTVEAHVARLAQRRGTSGMVVVLPMSSNPHDAATDVTYDRSR